MSSKWTLLVIVASIISLHTYKAYNVTGISGRISQRASGDMIWAINNADTVAAVPNNGTFMLDVKPGIYKVLVDAQRPFKDVIVQSIEVIQGKTTDLGEIKMIQ